MKVKVLGIDLGKTVFHLIGMDEHGKIVLGSATRVHNC